eukprot:2779999-Amphidinium_carterae.2
MSGALAGLASNTENLKPRAFDERSGNSLARQGWQKEAFLGSKTKAELPKSASGTLLAAVVQKDKRSILNVPLFPGGFKAIANILA